MVPLQHPAWRRGIAVISLLCNVALGAYIWRLHHTSHDGLSLSHSPEQPADELSDSAHSSGDTSAPAPPGTGLNDLKAASRETFVVNAHAYGAGLVLGTDLDMLTIPMRKAFGISDEETLRIFGKLRPAIEKLEDEERAAAQWESPNSVVIPPLPEASRQFLHDVKSAFADSPHAEALQSLLTYVDAPDLETQYTQRIHWTVNSDNESIRVHREQWDGQTQMQSQYYDIDRADSAHVGDQKRSNLARFFHIPELLDRAARTLDEL